MAATWRPSATCRHCARRAARTTPLGSGERSASTRRRAHPADLLPEPRPRLAVDRAREEVQLDALRAVVVTRRQRSAPTRHVDAELFVELADADTLDATRQARTLPPGNSQSPARCVPSRRRVTSSVPSRSTTAAATTTAIDRLSRAGGSGLGERRRPAAASRRWRRSAIDATARAGLGGVAMDVADRDQPPSVGDQAALVTRPMPCRSPRQRRPGSRPLASARLGAAAPGRPAGARRGRRRGAARG